MGPNPDGATVASALIDLAEELSLLGVEHVEQFATIEFGEEDEA
jgi:hypothetical protein